MKKKKNEIRTLFFFVILEHTINVILLSCYSSFFHSRKCLTLSEQFCYWLELSYRLLDLIKKFLYQYKNKILYLFGLDGVKQIKQMLIYICIYINFVGLIRKYINKTIVFKNY